MQKIKCRSCEDPSLTFVFGSNKASIHGAGAALHAAYEHGACDSEFGDGFGPMLSLEWMGEYGEDAVPSFAIPTKDERIQTLPLSEIKRYVNRFIGYAIYRPDLRFDVTRIGCGLAGYSDKDIAPMFRNAPENCLLPDGWREISLDNRS